jgi:hypothetical protein
LEDAKAMLDARAGAPKTGRRGRAAKKAPAAAGRKTKRAIAGA